MRRSALGLGFGLGLGLCFMFTFVCAIISNLSNNAIVVGCCRVRVMVRVRVG